MAKLKDIKKAKRGQPFGAPNAADDGTFSILIPEGAETGKIPASDQYIGQLTSLTRNVSQQGRGNPQWVFGFQIVKGKYAGMDFNLYCPLVPNSMWKLADVLAALGVKHTPGQETKFQRSDVLNTLVRMVIADGKTQDGRDRSQLSTVLPHPDGAGKKSKKAGFTPPKDEEDEEIEEQDEDEELDDEEQEETDDEDQEETDEDEEGEEEAEDEEAENEEAEDEEAEDEEDEEDEDEEPYGKVTPKRRGGPAVEERTVKGKKSKKDEDEWEPPPSLPRAKKGAGRPASKPARRGRGR